MLSCIRAQLAHYVFDLCHMHLLPHPTSLHPVTLPPLVFVQTSRVFKHEQVWALLLTSSALLSFLKWIGESVCLCLHDLVLAYLWPKEALGFSTSFPPGENLNHTFLFVCHVIDEWNEAIYLRYHFLQQLNLRDLKKKKKYRFSDNFM